jgi:hypothetical protein
MIAMPKPKTETAQSTYADWAVLLFSLPGLPSPQWSSGTEL